jgi:uncharacterized membrane protein YczE
MNAIFKAIGYRSSKSDRTVLKWFFIICSLAVFAIGLVILILLWGVLWSPQVKRDSARLDAILASQKIDAVEFISWSETNVVVGGNALMFVALLHKTNRIAKGDWTKLGGQHVRLLNGTNLVCGMFLVDDGTWKFGNYIFRLRP